MRFRQFYRRSVYLDIDSLRMRRRGTTGASISDAALVALEASLRQVLSWAARQPFLQVLPVEHHRILGDPAAESERIRGFLQLPLDTRAMSRQIEESLYRQRP